VKQGSAKNSVEKEGGNARSRVSDFRGKDTKNNRRKREGDIDWLLRPTAGHISGIKREKKDRKIRENFTP